jgi:predicted nucleotidyltransferase
VLPATEDVLQAGVIRFADSTMNANGLDLAVRHHTPLAIPGYEVAIEVATLSALVVLKVVAWQDRPRSIGFATRTAPSLAASFVRRVRRAAPRLSTRCNADFTRSSAG